MILVFLIAIPFAAGFLCLGLARRSLAACRWTALGATVTCLGLSIGLWAEHFHNSNPTAPAGKAGMLEQVDLSWIPQAGIRFHLGADGLSLVMLMLTFALIALAILSSWRGINERVGFFHLLIMWTAAGLAGVFVSLDLFLFYFFFELMLVPLFFVIALWGHEDRRRASMKFFIYTQAGGLLMLVAILGLYFLHGRATGVYTFDYLQLLGTALSTKAAFWLMLGFFLAFAVKLPALPLHGWLPDAHSQAPTAGSVILAGLLIKVGAYGMLRFLFPLFPKASSGIATVAMAIGVAGILYGAVLAFSQRDLKRLVAYTSVSHMGFVLLGIFAWNQLALAGVMLQIVCHAFSTGGLFIMAGYLEERLGTRDLAKMGNLWASLPRFGGVAIFLAMAALGLPGLGNFVAEFLILLGAFRVNEPLAIIAALGLVFATVYSLWLLQRVFHARSTAEAIAAPQKARPEAKLASTRHDLSAREIVTLAAAIIVILWLGLYPQTLIRTFQETSDSLLKLAPPAATQVTREPTP